MRKHIAFTLLLAAGVAASAAASTAPSRVLQLAKPGGPAAWATVPDQLDLRPAGSFTVEAWVRADPAQPLSPWPIVLTKPAGNLMNGECSYGFIVERANGHVHFRVTTTAGNFDAVWSGNLLDGTWHHVCGVRLTGGSDAITIVVDGVLAETRPTTGATLFSTAPLALGASEFTGYSGNALVGQIDEVRLWGLGRSQWSIDHQRGFELNDAPGLVAAWHFDDTYAGVWTPPQILDSVKGIVLNTSGATLQPGTAPVSRSLATLQLDQLGPRSGDDTDSWLAAVRIGGARDLVSGQGFRFTGFSPVAWSELDVVNLAGTPRVLGSLNLGNGAPVVRMAARDSVVFCLRAVPGFLNQYWLRSLRVSDPAHLAFFGDSLLVQGNVKMFLDPTNPNVLIAAGAEGFTIDNHVSFVDVSNPASPVMLLDVSLEVTGAERLLDVVKRGAYLYASFSDGTVRIYRYDVYLLNGTYLRSLTRTGSTLTLQRGCVLATSGTRLYAVDSQGALRTYDLGTPTTPGLLETWTDERAADATELAIDGDRLAIGGPNGVTFADARTGAPVKLLGFWCPDQRPEGAPSLTLRDGVCGLAAGKAGYAILAPGAPVTGVPRIAPAPVPMAASPNPSRGAVEFALPAGVPVDARLEILDVTGRRVRAVAVSAERGAWDGRDEAGRAVPAGVYLARIEAGGRAHLARVAIVR